MKQMIATVFLVGCAALAASAGSVDDSDKTLDLVVDQESKSIGVEAIQVGEVLRSIARGLRETSQAEGQAESETEEYFIKKLWKKTKNAVKQIGKGIEKGVKGVITSKAADIVKKFVQEKFGVYALEDGKAYKDFREDLAQEFDRAGARLVVKGAQLCQCSGRRKLDERERSFVQGVVDAL
uniref:Putative secreted protein n=1 Tax=Amblyomma triste TaxID=251400 RepID=A0A023GA62_AMBTT